MQKKEEEKLVDEIEALIAKWDREGGETYRELAARLLLMLRNKNLLVVLKK